MCVCDVNEACTCDATRRRQQIDCRRLDTHTRRHDNEQRAVLESLLRSVRRRRHDQTQQCIYIYIHNIKTYTIFHIICLHPDARYRSDLPPTIQESHTNKKRDRQAESSQKRYALNIAATGADLRIFGCLAACGLRQPTAGSRQSVRRTGAPTHCVVPAPAHRGCFLVGMAHTKRTDTDTNGHARCTSIILLCSLFVAPVATVDSFSGACARRAAGTQQTAD